MLLEKVGTATVDPALASHWLTEAANVWVLSLNDAHRAARALMIAIDRDPTQPTAAERLAELYKEKGDTKALAALLERRAKALAPLAQRDPAVRTQVAGIHEELGRLWGEPPLSNPSKAVENYRRALDYDPTSQYAIYSIREAFKTAGQVADAIPYYALEQALVDDPARKVSLYADEAEVRRSIGDIAGALASLENARDVDPQDAGLKQQLATLILDRVREGQAVEESWKAAGAQLFVELAEEYSGEHGYAYSSCALEILPGHDRAMQLALHYAGQLGRTGEVGPIAARYLAANPGGAMAAEASAVAGNAPAPAPVRAPIEPSRPIADAVVSRKADAADRTLDDFDPDSGIDDVEDDEPESSGGSAFDALVTKAQQLAAKNRKNEASAIFRDILKTDPIHPEAIAFLQTYLRQARKYGDLRDVLLRASKSTKAVHEDRVAWLREVAALCESQIRDFDTAIAAFQQLIVLEPDDEQSRDQLRRLLERANRWDDLATLLEQEAEQESDVEARLVIEKHLAKLHESKRKDLVAAGHAWARISTLTPEDDTAIATAVKLFEKGDRPDLAAQVIADNVGSVADEPSRAALYKRLGDLRRATGDMNGAGEAFTEAARLTQEFSVWETAERAFADAQSWARAAAAVNERSELAKSPRQKAELLGLEAAYLSRAGDGEGAIGRLDQAVDADPTDEDLAAELENQLRAADRLGDVATLFTRRADKHPDKTPRVSLRKRAAQLYRETLGDPAAARECLERVLEDGDDTEALSLLASDAEERGDFPEAVEYLSRLERASSDPSSRTVVALRQSRLLAEGVRDVDAAIEQYQRVLDDLDPKNQEALAAVANLEEGRGKHDAAAAALEKHLALVAAPEMRIELARRLAEMYEEHLDEPRAALKAFNVVYAADPDDFQAVQKIVELAERLEEWSVVAEHTARLVEVEGDEEEVSRMTRRLAEILTDRLDRGDEAVAALAEVGDLGDAPCREAFVELGDRLGKKKLVATKLVEWFGHSPPSAERDAQLHGAFERFVEVGADEESASVAKELARMRIARPGIAEALEAVSVRLRDLDALSIAHDLVARQLTGPSRAEEMVRQAEVLVKAGVETAEAVRHGEQALTSVAPEDVEPLLERLAKLLPSPSDVIDLYERQIGRCKAPTDRLAALARAAQIAAERDDLERARRFFDLVLSGGAPDATIEALERVARATDASRNSVALRTTLAESLAAGGQASRDGGRMRGALLRRAAVMAFHELKDHERAFAWLGDSLVTHVDDAGLDALVELADEVGDVSRADTVITRALGEVFDGPLVRKLLGRRADIRADRLGDKRAAAEDLKRLHELAPADAEVMEKLSVLYTELEDYRGMVQLYEDQILRGRDQSLRAELARKVARLWEGRLDDAREAADAWRRVLRMKAGDTEATMGLERAKANMLKKPPPAEDDAPDVKKSSPSNVVAAPLPPPPSPPSRPSNVAAAALPPPPSVPSNVGAAPPELDDSSSGDETDVAKDETAAAPESTDESESPPSASSDDDENEGAAGQDDAPAPRPRYAEPVTPTTPEDVVQAAAAASADGIATPVPGATANRAAPDSDAPTAVFAFDTSASTGSETPPAGPVRAALNDEETRREPLSQIPLPPVPQVPPPAPPADDSDLDVDIDLSGLGGSEPPPPFRAPPPPPPKRGGRSRPPPPPSAAARASVPAPAPRSSTPPPLPGAPGAKPPPPPSLRNSAPPPPPPRKRTLTGSGDEESEDIVDDDELF
jgi:tetratricopeptide (TPR) repeat protein